jgi:hypothetical protein
MKTDEPPGEPERVEPGRAARAAEERGLGRDVRSDAGAGGDGDIAPRCDRWTGGRGIDQVVLHSASAQPDATRDARGGKAATRHAHRAAGGQAHLDGHGRRQIAAGADPARACECERVVDGAALHDAVQIEHERHASQQHATAQAERCQGLDRHGLDCFAIRG